MDSILDFYNITEYVDGFNTSFLLNDNNNFSITDYKVLRGQIRGGLARCEKVLFNGRIKLLYLTDGCTALENLLLRMDERLFVSVLTDILKVFIDIKENGFLESQRLLVTPEYIFVDENTMKVRMIYLPVDIRMSHSFTQLYQLRPVIIRLLHAGTRFSAGFLQRITMLFSDEQFSLNEIYNELLSQCNHSGALVPETSQGKNGGKVLTMLSMNEPVLIKFCIDKRDFSIGRDAGHVDGAIMGNPVVGRKHCHVLYRDGDYYIEDDSSKNGTFLNGVKLEKGAPKKIPENACIRIANISFEVRYD